MTTAAYRDGVLAADTRAYSGDRMPIGYKRKLRQVLKGEYAGSWFVVSTAVTHQVEALARWFENGLDPDGPTLPAGEPSFVALMVTPALETFFFCGSYIGSRVEDEFLAIGSGEAFALGAMAAGADAVRAVEIAAQLDVYTGGKIDHVDLRNLNS